jgi:aminoglycoside phosphotransferase (APT) family kinase protein
VADGLTTEVTEVEARSAAEQLLGEPVSEVEQIARSSNHVFRLTTVTGARYSLRVPLLHPNRLSAFWQQLRDTFGLRYGTQLGHVRQLAERIDRDGIVAAPRPVASGAFGDTTAYVFTWVDGTAWEPDEFPGSADVHERLGRYLATLHASTSRPTGFGTLEHQPFDRGQLIARANQSMATIVHSYWTHRPEVVDHFERQIAKTRPEALAGPPSPIMPDISGNQFVYRDGRIAGIVDLDSYVAGPRELELTTAELCLTRPDDFRRGYEEILPLPRFEPFRTYWRFWLMINDLDWAPDLTEFLTAKTSFA